MIDVTEEIIARQSPEAQRIICALLAQDYQALVQTLEQGLATPQHAAFVEELAKRRAKA